MKRVVSRQSSVISWLVLLCLFAAALLAQSTRPPSGPVIGPGAKYPPQGTGFAPNHAAVINSLGAIDAASGTSSNCVHVDGGSAACGGGAAGVTALSIETQDAGNGADTTEDALMTYTLPGGTLGAGTYLRIRAHFSYGGTGSAGTVRVRFGSTVGCLETPGASGIPIEIDFDAFVVGLSASSQKIFCSIASSDDFVDSDYVTASEAAGGNLTIKGTGQTTGSPVINNFIQRSMVIELGSLAAPSPPSQVTLSQLSTSGGVNGNSICLTGGVPVWCAASGGGALTVASNGTTVGTRGTVNFIAGSGVLNTISDTGSQINVQQSADTAIVLSKATAQAGTPWLCASASASGTAYTCAMSPTLSAYTTGMVLNWIADVTAGSSPTLNVDTIGAKAVKEADGATAATASDVVAGHLYQIWYDGTAFRIIPPPASGGGSTISVIAYETASYSAPTANSWTPVTFDSHVDKSSGTMHSVSVNTDRFTAPTTATYLATCEVQWPGSSTTYTGIDITVNGARAGTSTGASAPYIYAGAGDAIYGWTKTKLFYLNAGDYVSCLQFQFASPQAAGSGATSTSMQFIRMP